MIIFIIDDLVRREVIYKLIRREVRVGSEVIIKEFVRRFRIKGIRVEGSRLRVVRRLAKVLILKSH